MAFDQKVPFVQRGRSLPSIDGASLHLDAPLHHRRDLAHAPAVSRRVGLRRLERRLADRTSRPRGRGRGRAEGGELGEEVAHDGGQHGGGFGVDQQLALGEDVVCVS
eukprot:2069822-Prymnesium_polylepis.1